MSMTGKYLLENCEIICIAWQGFTGLAWVVRDEVDFYLVKRTGKEFFCKKINKEIAKKLCAEDIGTWKRSLDLGWW